MTPHDINELESIVHPAHGFSGFSDFDGNVAVGVVSVDDSF